MLELIEAIHTAAGPGPGDDAWGWRQAGGATHLWVIDGATSVSERPEKAQPGLSDAAWFAQNLSRGIHRLTATAPLSEWRLAGLLEQLLARYRALAGPELAPHDWPLAAMTYACIRRFGDRTRIDGLAYADCFLHLAPLAQGQAVAGVDRPAPNPPIPTPARPAKLPDDPALMTRLRARRRDQVLHGASSALTIFPRSVHAGRRFCLTRPAARDWLLLIGSDGAARIWEEYRLSTQAATAARIARHGAAREIAALRRWEARHGDHGLSPKPADDATLLTALLRR